MKNKILSILLSLAIAIGLWVYVITAADPEYEQSYNNVKVELQNDNILEENGLMIVSQTQYVSLRLKGNRTTLAGLKEKDLTATANVSNITAPGQYKLTYTLRHRGNTISNAVPLKQSPDVITLFVEKEATKEVEIRADITGTVPAGFEADIENPVFEPEKITVTGPASVVDKVQYAKIDEQISVDSRQETLSGEYTYTLCDEEGQPVDAKKVSTNIERINMQIRIEQVKEMKLDVKVIEGGGLTRSDVILEPTTIQISGPKAKLDELGDTLVIGEGLDLSKLDKNQPIAKIPVTLPEGITNRSGITEVAVMVNFGDLAQRTMELTNFSCENVPDGMTAELVTQKISVTLRGPQALVDSITEADLTVTVNLADAQAGNVTRTAVVTVASGYEGVVAVGAYNISLTLTKN